MKTPRFEELQRRIDRGHWLTPAEARELIRHADIMESCARMNDEKQPFCEHENRYAFTDDGGKTGWCVMCENVRLQTRLLNVARGCMDYGGGYRDSDNALAVFHHGVQTVINALTAAVKNDPKDGQVNALEMMGRLTGVGPETK